MQKKYNDHLFTFGNNDKPEYDKVLTGKDEFNLKQTLDYIWEIIPDYNLDIFKNGADKICNFIFDDDDDEKDEGYKQEESKVIYESLKVEEFLVKNRPYQQLSDHFGVSVELLFPSRK